MNIGDLFLYVSKSAPLDKGYFMVELVTGYDYMGTVNAISFSSLGIEPYNLKTNGFVELEQSTHWIKIA